MTFKLDLQLDAQRINRNISSIERDVVDVAIPRALNVGGRKTNTAFIRGLSADTGVKQKELRRKVRILRASKNLARVVLRFNPRGFNPTKLGMSAKKAQALYVGEFVGQAFAATMPNGSRQIAVRLPSSRDSTGRDSKGRPRHNRLPINTIRVRIGRKGVELMRRTLQTVGREAFIKEYERQLGLIRKKR